MIIDIGMAFVVACIIELCSSFSKFYKYLVIFVSCITLILIYFINGDIGYLGKIDLGIWILFVVVFDLLILITKMINNKF